MLFNTNKIHEQFQRYCRIVPATTAELKNQAYSIRHQVYCEELEWLPSHNNFLETDPYDQVSHHCLLQNVTNNEFIGCIRMVLAIPSEPQASMPFQLTCKQLKESEPDQEQLMQGLVGEVSRLAVLRQYRHRPQEQFKAVSLTDADFGTAKQPRFPYIPIGLYMGVLEMARLHNVKTLYILTDPSLARHLCRLGGKLERIGDPVEHLGTRIPYKMVIDEVISQMNPALHPLFDVICDEVRQGYQDQFQPHLTAAE
ncbi:PEP-CTERM/exosortase system-associated acyltransferase [Motiliproteus coralliicola]|nr:PEP-CTERM/exosortase system-associated acyltransferase [Motiliproteus coralliicola]